ncbi:MAG: hypothetical protein GW772_06670 [Flavobacteriia bacterium]|nr:hypothetical protein [Flavobacteriia bacterium]OIP45066.1 MAG: hypothetical protein AUK46_13110 [Flavobacteriaceae bacterium CG2_30_31_66]PIV95260.1 MAG: hypothetical protein COW43_14025 [Flavobacteriaceae bacterium CG17_big_fil_post_rev_8_21_14_2_50_31_13]PIX13077.1 MAG: hypothetical protein COZ74_08145 [Flavobacteriaceae bacterium CG_4_8_14_3_um_filter_31_8]PIY13591.1 MAG: hypothetical protein COZ16_13200 [Flavobacteriaceae bacterium CG_4_10_14_3_um_filter_31_253]PIZ11848.1 MAG: hypotheti
MTQNSKKTPNSFWLIGVLALIWNAFGVYFYLELKFMTDEMKSKIPVEQLSIIENTPAWATAAFAIAVWFGFFGSILLLMRKKIAKGLFMISLAGIFVQMIYNIFLLKSTEISGSSRLIIPFLTISIGIFLIWQSKKYTENGIVT